MFNLSIDFGMSCTDIAMQDTETEQLHFFSSTFIEQLNEPAILDLLSSHGIDISQVANVAVTGGHHEKIKTIGDKKIIHVNEIDAVGYAARFFCPNDARIGCITSGTGTGSAFISKDNIMHTGGTPSGGGTLMGLAELTLGVSDPMILNEMANAGNSTNVNLSIAEAVTGPIGTLAADAPASFFAKITRGNKPSPEDIAAGLCVMIGSGIGMLAASLSSHQKTDIVCIIGRTPKIDIVKDSISLILTWQGCTFKFPRNAEFGTAIGALQAI